MNSLQSKRIIFLDYLRIFAFTSVLVGHKLYLETSTLINSYKITHITERVFTDLLLSLFYAGGAGVIVFFMISGYIILHVIQFENIKSFMIRRVFRIYPLLIMAILIEVYFVQNNVSTTDLFIQMTLMGNFFNTPYSLKGVEWTLRVEIIFYIFMLVLKFVHLETKGYKLVSVFVIAVLILNYISPFPTTGRFYSYFTVYAPFLFLGSVFYLYHAKKISLFTLFIFSVFIFLNYFSMVSEFLPKWQKTNFAISGFILFLLFFNIENNLQKLHEKFGSLNKIIFSISALTYSVYLFHNYLWNVISETLGIDNKLIIIIILFVFCTIMYNIIEKPMNKLAKKLTKKGNHNEK